MLAPLIREGLVAVWSDHKIVAGADIDREIQAQLKRADVVLLLLSPDFLNSDYCYSVEMAAAIERHDNGRSIVIPIVLRDSDWGRTPIARLKALPTDAQPIAGWPNTDAAWLSVVTEIRRAVLAEQDRRQRVNETPKPLEKSMREMLRSNFQHIQERHDGVSVNKIKLGLKAVDEPIGGLERGELFLVAARPQSGLLEFCLGSAIYTTLKYKQKVMVASPRAKAERMSQRVLTAIGRVDTGRLQRGMLEDDEWDRLSMSIKILADANISFYDEPDFDISNLEKHVLDVVSDQGLDYLILDGLEFISNGQDGDEARIVKKLASIARKANVCVLANLTLGPQVDRRRDRRPLISDLESWHALHQQADGIIFLYRDSNYAGEVDYKDLVEVIVAKNPRGQAVSAQACYWEGYGIFDPMPSADDIQQ